MVEYGIDLDTRPVAKQLQKIGRDMPAINRGILGLLAEQIVDDAQNKYLRGSGSPLRWRSGKLAQSLTHKVGNNFADVGSNLAYARIHEEGGTIHAKGKKLAIPIGSMKGSPRDHDLKFTMRGRSMFLMDAGGQFQYVLKDSVKIPKRPYLGPPIKDLFQSGKAELIADRELQRQFDKRD